MSLETGETCRADVWLWRARFFKTRGLAAGFIEEGRVRLTRAEGRACDREARLDKPSRTVRPGDALVFAVGGRVVAVRIESCGERRGPASEARTLYSDLDTPSPKAEAPDAKVPDSVAESRG